MFIKPISAEEQSATGMKNLTGKSSAEGSYSPDVLAISGWPRGKLNVEQCVAKALKFSKNCSSSFLKENL